MIRGCATGSTSSFVRGLLGVALAVVAAGCATVGPTATPSGEPATASSSTAPAGSPVASAPSPSVLPSATEAPVVTPPPSTPAVETPPAPTATDTGPDAAAACTGSAANREFYAAVAAGVDWSVYCPVLPSGWYVESGSYRLSGGARLEIVYKGPSGARLELHEGAWCTGTEPCIPAGSDAGTTAFGDRDGDLIAAEDGSWAVAVDDGGADGWLLIGSNLDEEAVRTIAAELATVGR